MAIQKKNSALESALSFIKSKASQGVSNIKETASNIKTANQGNFKNFYSNFSKDYDNFKKTQSQVVSDSTNKLSNRLFSTKQAEKPSTYKPVEIKPLNLFKFKDVAANYANKFTDRSSKVLIPSLKRAAGTAQVSSGLLLDAQNKIASSPITKIMPGGTAVRAIVKNPIVSKTLKDSSNNIIKGGLEKMKKADEEKQMKVGNLVDKGFLNNIKDPEWLAENLTYTVPSFLTSLGTGAAATLASGNPAVGFIAAVGPSYLLTAGDVYDEAKKQGANEDMARNAANITGIASGLLDAVGIGPILENIGGKEAKGLVIKEVVKNMAKSAISEGSTETLQQLIQNAVAKVSYDTKRDLTTGLLESGFLGGLMGAGGSVGVDTTTNAVNTYNNMSPQERQAGFIGVPGKDEQNNITNEQTQLEKVINDMKKTPETSSQLNEMNPEDINLVQNAINYINNATNPEDIMSVKYGTNNNIIRDFAQKYVDPTVAPDADIYEVINKINEKLDPESTNVEEPQVESQQTETKTASETKPPEESFTQPETTPNIPLGEAVWKNKNSDIPVVVTGYLGLGPDGKHYVSIEGSDTGVPAGDLEYEGKKERGLITSIRENELKRDNVRNQVYGLYDTTTDEGRMSYGREYVQNNPDVAEKRALDIKEPLTNETVSIYYALDEYLSKLADDAEKAGNKELAEVFDARAVAVENMLAEKTTPQAQVLQFLHRWSNKTPAKLIRWAEKVHEQANEFGSLSLDRMIKKVSGKEYEIKLSEEMKKEIPQRLREIKKMPEGIEKNKAMLQLMRDITKDIPPSFLQLTDAYRYENMLSSPRTHLRNAVLNLVNAEIIYPATLAQQSINDVFLNIATGKEKTASILDVPKYYIGQIAGVAEGIKDFYKVMTGELSALDIDAKYGDDQNTLSIQALTAERMPVYLSIFRRLLLGSDRFMTNVIKSGEEARLKSNGIDPKEAEAKALEKAAYWLYTSKNDPFNKSGQGSLLSSMDSFKDLIHKASSSKKGGIILRYAVPFVNITINTAKMAAELNPITGLFTLINSTRKSEQIAKMMVGSYAMSAFAVLAAKGMTTWGLPEDRDEREKFFASGRKAYSFKLPGYDMWIPMAYLGPLAWTAGIPAAIKHYYKDSPEALTDSEMERIQKIAGDALGFFTEQTPITGLAGLLKTAQGDFDQSVAKNLGFNMGQLIPWNSMLRYINTVVDPVFRKSTGFTDEIKKSIPGATKDMEAYVTPSGEESTRNITDYVFPYTLGKPNEGFEELYQNRKNELQQNTVNRAFEDAAREGSPLPSSISENKKLEEKDVKSRMKTYFETDNQELKQQIVDNLSAGGWNIGDAIELVVKNEREKDLKGMSEESVKLLNRSTDFETVRRIIENYGDKPGAEKIIADKMAEKGISQEDMLYDNQTAMPEDIRSEEIFSNISGLQGEELLTVLVSFRRESEGTRKALLTDGIINDLVDEGIITKGIGKYLKNITWDSKNKEFKALPNDDGTSKGAFKLSVPHLKSSSGGVKIKMSDVPKLNIKIPESGYKLIKSKKPKVAERKLQVRKIALPKKTRGTATNINQLGRI